MNESLFQKLKRVRLADIGHVFLFLAALIPAFLLKKRRPHIWLVCEGPAEARDNGYCFFRYLTSKQPQTDACYAIDPSCRDHEKVAGLGEVIPYGTFRHWVYYLASEVNVSSQKYGNPNAAVCYLLEILLGWLKKKKVFLQHGVTKDDLPFLYYDKARFSLFCCAAEREYEFIRDRFGYPDGAVRLTGFCRFDSMKDALPEDRTVLILPTWRMYLQRDGDRERFADSEYYSHWNGLLSDPGFIECLEKNDIRAVFCAHREMKAFEDMFSSPSDRISVMSWEDADIPGMIREKACLITDYSSVYMDFAYMRKPVIYYQFDTDEYRSGHLSIGYFDYADDGFGPICRTSAEVTGELVKIAGGGWGTDALYRERADAFFPVNDGRNCERTYDAVREMLEKSL